MSSTPTLSLLVALFNEEAVIDEFVARVRHELDEVSGGRDRLGEPFTWEIVFVDDGSSDHSVAIAEKHAAEDERIKVVQLARNYGKEAAITAAIEHASGDYLLMMDPDLQDPPERILDFKAKIEEGYDLVFGIRTERNDKFLTRMFSAIFWKTLRVFTGLNVPTGLAVMRIFNRHFAEEFTRYSERRRFMEGLFMDVGLRRTTIAVEHNERFAGVSKFNFRRRMKLALNAILAFGDRPIRLAISIGLTLVGLSFLFGLYVIWLRLVYDNVLSGWTTLVTIIVFLSGMQTVIIGLIGLYIGNTYQEVKGRPLYRVQQRVNVGPPRG